MTESRHSDRGFVVVTGASTGIGAATVSGTHFVSDGNLVPLPRPNLKADDAEGAKRYADEPADKVSGGSPVAAASSVGRRGDR